MVFSADVNSVFDIAWCVLARMMFEDPAPEDFGKENERPEGIMICCHHCGLFFIRNAKHQQYCDRPECQKARNAKKSAGLPPPQGYRKSTGGEKKVTPLVTQLSWTNHLLIMSGSKSDEEREFYMRLAIKERYSKRQLERQMDSGYYERYMLSKSKLLSEPLHSEQNPFLDQYVVEFLDLPATFHENDFRKALVKGMRDFIRIRMSCERNCRNCPACRK